MLRWMCGVTRREIIRNEHYIDNYRVVPAITNIVEKRVDWYGQVRRTIKERMVRRLLDRDTTENTKRALKPKVGGKMRVREI